jgi:UDP-GlcNAc:undecaprenyl-phosphate GlcNAc-1-phosphate transferase
MPEFFIAFAGVFALTFALMPLSSKLGLVDKPDQRKQHKGDIPLIGGIAMFASCTAAAFLFVPPNHEMGYLLAACALLTITGSIDDRFNLHYQIRLTIQILSAFLLIWGANTWLRSFGSLLGTGPISLGWLSIPITVLAVVGLINAFNMIDGMDGLSGGLCLISATSLYFLIGDKIADGASNILLLMMGALTAYIIMNLHLLPKWTPKIFMGDAGSMLLGFIITAFLIRYSQGYKQIMMPVTALWLVAIPLMDIFVTFARRIKHGKNPFHPDRTHIHHIFMRTGLSSRATLIIILSFQAVASAIGVTIEKYLAVGWISFSAFIILFIFYLNFIKHAFKFTKWVRKNISMRKKLN